MRRYFSWLGKSCLLLAGIVYPWLLHSLLLQETGDVTSWLLVIIPPLVFGYWWALRSAHKLGGCLLVTAALVLLYFLFVQHHARLGLAAANGVAHLAVNLFLLWFFGRTLLPSHEPLITRIARRLHGQLTPDLVIYTRQVTVAWCIFFAVQIVGSILLYSLATLPLWSFFINILNLPLLLLMVLAEYVYRASVYRDRPRTSLWAVVCAYTQDVASSTHAVRDKVVPIKSHRG